MRVDTVLSSVGGRMETWERQVDQDGNGTIPWAQRHRSRLSRLVRGPIVNALLPGMPLHIPQLTANVERLALAIVEKPLPMRGRESIVVMHLM